MNKHQFVSSIHFDICWVFFVSVLFRSTSAGQSNYVKIPPKLAQLISQAMNGSTSVFNTESLLSARVLWLQTCWCSWVRTDEPCESLPSQGMSVMCAHTCCLISKLLVLWHQLVAADVLVCIRKCDFFFFFLRLLAVFFLSGPLTQLSCVSLLLLPQQQTNLINIRPPVSKCFSVPANETSLESVSTIAFFHSEKSIYFFDLNWFEIFI